MDEGAQVQSEVAAYALPHLQTMVTILLMEYLRTCLVFIMSASQMLHGVRCQTNTSGQLPFGGVMQRPDRRWLYI